MECNHVCTSDCRREGCNCNCGEFHIIEPNNPFLAFREALEKKLRQKPKKVLYPRQELIKKFVDRLNEDRIASKMTPLPPHIYAIKMYQSGLKTDFLLWWFYGYCNDARDFSKCWWWSLKADNKNK